jgi:hypothetical protein
MYLFCVNRNKKTELTDSKGRVGRGCPGAMEAATGGPQGCEMLAADAVVTQSALDAGERKRDVGARRESTGAHEELAGRDAPAWSWVAAARHQGKSLAVALCIGVAIFPGAYAQEFMIPLCLGALVPGLETQSCDSAARSTGNLATTLSLVINVCFAACSCQLGFVIVGTVESSRGRALVLHALLAGPAAAITAAYVCSVTFPRQLGPIAAFLSTPCVFLTFFTPFLSHVAARVACGGARLSRTGREFLHGAMLSLLAVLVGAASVSYVILSNRISGGLGIFINGTLSTFDI